MIALPIPTDRLFARPMLHHQPQSSAAASAHTHGLFIVHGSGSRAYADDLRGGFVSMVQFKACVNPKLDPEHPQKTYHF